MVNTLQTSLYGIPKTSNEPGQSLFHVEMHAQSAKLQVPESACPREHTLECERGIVGTLQTCSYTIYNTLDMHGQSIFYPKMDPGANTQKVPALENTSQNGTGACWAGCKQVRIVFLRLVMSSGSQYFMSTCTHDPPNYKSAKVPALENTGQNATGAWYTPCKHVRIVSLRLVMSLGSRYFMSTSVRDAPNCKLGKVPALKTANAMRHCAHPKGAGMACPQDCAQ
jgi:hypothetical protein